MEKLKTVRGVHDLLPQELYKHHEVINTALEISNKFNYSQIEIPIFVKKNNFYGVQFHPEKSQISGIKIIDNFLKIL